jgi:hypothetical protein
MVLVDICKTITTKTNQPTTHEDRLTEFPKTAVHKYGAQCTIVSEYALSGVPFYSQKSLGVH